jgi:hypothetical protein
MTTTYEIRTMRNAPVYAFDNLENAKVELRKSEKRIGRKLVLVEITRTEREIVL